MVKKVIDESDYEDLMSRVTALESIRSSCIEVLADFADKYRGLCFLYGVNPDNYPGYTQALRLVEANKDILQIKE